MELNEFKAIAFDFDGTLNDRSLHHAARKAAYLALAEELDDNRYALIDDEIQINSSNLASTSQIINALILSSAGIIDSLDSGHPAVLRVVNKKYEIYQQLIAQGQPEIQGATSFIKRLTVRKPGAIGIVTTALYNEVIPFLKRYQLTHYLPRQKIVAYEDLSAPSHVKPDPESYITFMDRFNISTPSECLVIEDSSIGIESAKRAGAIVIGMIIKDNPLSKDMATEYKPDYVVNNYAQLGILLGMQVGTKS